MLYPLVVLGLLLVRQPAGHRRRGLGHPCGRRRDGDDRRPPLSDQADPLEPWKSLGGSLALAVFGGAAGVFLAWWCRDTVMPPAYGWFPFVAPILAAIAAAAVETIPISLDDNVSVTATAAAVMWAISLVSADLLAAACAHAAVDGAARAVGQRRRRGRRDIGPDSDGIGRRLRRPARTDRPRVRRLAGLGPSARLRSPRRWSPRVSACIAKSSLASQRSAADGGAPGTRSPTPAMAAVAALMAVLTYAHDPALLGFTAALVAGASDTVASEIGKAWGRRTFLLTTLRPCRQAPQAQCRSRGRLRASAVRRSWRLPPVRWAWWSCRRSGVVVVAATAGALVESALGATLEHRGVVNNDVLNFVNTGVAAFVAVKLAQSL